jgi:hypothetical protein
VTGTNLRKLLSAALGLGLVVVGVAVIAANSSGNSTARGADVVVPAAATNGTNEATYPDDVYSHFLKDAESHAQADGLLRIEDDGGAVYYTPSRSYALMLVSYHARQIGLPYNESDLMAPLTDDSGQVVAYQAVNVGRLIKASETADPGFELCRLQLAGLAAAEQSAVATGVVDASEATSAPINCTPKG